MDPHLYIEAISDLVDSSRRSVSWVNLRWKRFYLDLSIRNLTLHDLKFACRLEVLHPYGCYCFANTGSDIDLIPKSDLRPNDVYRATVEVLARASPQPSAVLAISTRVTFLHDGVGASWQGQEELDNLKVPIA